MKNINKAKIIIALVVVIAILNWTTISEIMKFNTTDFLSITGSSIIEQEKESKNILIEESTVPIEIYFCATNNCTTELGNWLNAAEKKIHCAFFELELEEIKTILVEKSTHMDVKLIVDANYIDEVENMAVDIHNDTRTAFMHNKFCILDDKAVWTGSFNPTYRGANKNDNNAVFIQSQNLAENYEQEFEEMWNGVYGAGNTTIKTEMMLNNIKIENYFIPEDAKSDVLLSSENGNHKTFGRLIDLINQANHSVKFMTFSFTDDSVGNALVRAFERKNVQVQGVFEKSQNNKYLEKTKLENAGIEVRWDGNPANMHHKVFIIDETIVYTGSANPSTNGFWRNDENILIIHDADIAALYVAEFERIWNLTETS